MPQIMISQENFSRLQASAVPLVDTIDTVVARALDALERGTLHESNAPSERVFDAASPPDLSFTTVRWASVDGAVLAGAETYWNLILMAVIRAAVAHGAISTQISKRLLANHIDEMKEDGGYKFVPEAGLSVQGQDANNAWKSAAYLADGFGISIEVAFVWQNNPKAALPGQAGRLVVNSNNAR